ncbi:TPA: hypothetical protein ACF9IQ_002318 [Staphylococcus aureus]|nr:hypothetical protein [Staphylococcus aureus]HDG4926817.1 hypothetical protein [Staphylococcus aureus]HDY5190422.1 hypothetical protein [Staphylococcus aureus]
MIKIKGIKEDIPLTPENERRLDEIEKRELKYNILNGLLSFVNIVLTVSTANLDSVNIGVSAMVTAISLFIVLVCIINNEQTRNIVKEALLEAGRHQDAQRVRVGYKVFDIVLIVINLIQVGLQVSMWF